LTIEWFLKNAKKHNGCSINPIQQKGAFVQDDGRCGGHFFLLT